MADHYVKLWASIVDSSVWAEPDRHRIVWITMLTLADRNGFVGASVDGLARRANVPEADVEAALESFLAPDPRSRNKEEDGRRIRVVPRGWHIINHGYFRDLQDREELRLYEKERKREQRDRARMSGTDGDISDKRQFVPSASSDADSDAVKRESTRGRRSKQVTKPDDVSEEVWQDWIEHRRRKRASVTARVLATTRKDATAAGMTLDDALAHWVKQGYQGFFPPSAGKAVAANGRPVVASSKIHMQNMPLGAPNCQCTECFSFRAKRAQ